MQRHDLYHIFTPRFTTAVRAPSCHMPCHAHDVAPTTEVDCDLFRTCCTALLRFLKSAWRVPGAFENSMLFHAFALAAATCIMYCKRPHALDSLVFCACHLLWLPRTDRHCTYLICILNATCCGGLRILFNTGGLPSIAYLIQPPAQRQDANSNLHLLAMY